MLRGRSERFLDGVIMLCLPTALHRRHVHREVHFASLFVLRHRVRMHGVGDPRILCWNQLHRMRQGVHRFPNVSQEHTVQFVQPQDVHPRPVRHERQLLVHGELGWGTMQQVFFGQRVGLLDWDELLLVRRWVLGPDLSLGVPVFSMLQSWVLCGD